MTAQTSKTPQIIAIDIDDVVANVLESVRVWANEATGVLLDSAEYHTSGSYWNYYDSIWTRHGLSDTLNFDMMLQAMASDQSSIRVVENAKSAIQALKMKYAIVFVTSRPTYQRDATREWLDRYIDPDIPVYFAHNPTTNTEGRSKGEICAELGASVLIDDHVENCQSAIEHGVEPLLFGSYGWNDNAPAHLKRYLTWDEIQEDLLSEAR